ncbi:alcohol dehydrogenase catalytic domain-containing protein [Cupriavidus sp. L7L]|uniref:alcohol dehydrogenase catalytic domain-containing protein n=1 Tax=Cupriavidus sp. L7L TaxID=2546443 RepID=UPI0010558D3F|nr:alcohol dehydrogenase catalytic domain-containing protein [Cupriavidus sp. L7L]TDF64966.1 L-threonine 3-dehydrogenase [Cupriavidus sp. L7L]
MLALSKVEPGLDGLAVGQHEVRAPAADEILLKVHVAGVCGTDMQVYRGTGTFARRVQLPTILGHEVCGTVVEVGAGVQSVRKGDLVSLESHIPCWQCPACLSGRSHVCPRTRYPGIDIDGAFAEYVTVPASIAWVNPPDASPEMAALLEPLGIAVHATLEGSGVSGQVVVVNGCGPIGLMNVAVARHFGARRVIAVDPNPARRRVAELMGADHAVDPIAQSPVDVVRDMTGGEGADVVFEYTGSAEGARNCFAMAAPLAEVRWCATPAGPIEFDFGLWRKGRPTVYNIHGRRLWRTWQMAAPLVYDRHIDLGPIASHRVPLAEGKRAFELIVAGEAIKPMIICS